MVASDSGSFAIPCVPKFDGDYEHWSLVMENLLRSKEYWSAIQFGFEEPKGNEALNVAQQKEINEARLKDLRAKNYHFQSIDKENYHSKGYFQAIVGFNETQVSMKC